MKRSIVLLALSAGCVAGQYLSPPADHPLSRVELGSRDVTVSAADQRLADAVARAMSSEGFKIVTHAPYHTELELDLSVVKATDGVMAVGTLRSDGFFVAEAIAPEDDAAPEVLAKELAQSQAMADFVRNSGLPVQTNFGPD